MGATGTWIEAQPAGFVGGKTSEGKNNHFGQRTNQKLGTGERKVIMETQKISFPNQQARCVFLGERLDLAQAISDLELEGHYPVIVLVGSGIAEPQAAATRRAIKTIARVAEDLHALVICGGTDMGVMVELGRIKGRNHYQFPLVSVTPEDLAVWPGGPHRQKFLWWGKQRWQLEPNSSHFILVPGSRFVDASPWIDSAATMLSDGHPSVTILINGGEISRKDIELSLKKGRPVIVLSRTGHLADELARQPERDNLITVVPIHTEQRILKTIQAALSITEKATVDPLATHEKVVIEM